ncbi:interleukin-17C [Diretmus argenteus]
MDVIQIVFFGLLLLFACVSASKFPCYDEEELKDKADKKLSSHYPQPPEPRGLAAAGSPVCPVELYQQSVDIKSRSLSPWRYISNTEEDRFPPTIAEAECLCEGCIMTMKDAPREESFAYNSVPITQHRVVLRRKLCEDKKRYRLVPENINVAVGCTCVKAKTSQV